MSRTIPTINTPRLTLRAMRPQDFDRYAEIWAHGRVIRHIGGKPLDRSGAWSAFLRMAGHWQVTGFGQWAVVPHGATQIMGQTGFFYGSRSLGEDFDNWPEAGWVLHPDIHGQGLGREATKAAHDWFDRVIAGPLVCMISPDNAASLHLAEVLGYVPLRETTFQEQPVSLMIRKAPPDSPKNILEEVQPVV